MSSNFIIELKGMRFFADHGMYREESVVGNEFEVDVRIEVKAPETVINSLQQTLNYVEVYRLVEEEFRLRTLLLESSAMQIAERMQQQFPQLQRVEISIRKLNPPITNFTGSVAVHYSKVFPST